MKPPESARPAQPPSIASVPRLDPELTRDGPETALGLVAARLGLGATAPHQAAAFAQHVAPSSLQALVSVAAEIGLVARAFRAAPPALGQVTLPAVVQLRAGDGAAGFAVLSALEDNGVVLEVGKRGSRRTLPLELFTLAWTGIVVTFAPAADAPPMRAPSVVNAAWAWLSAAGAADRPARLARRMGALLLTLVAGAGGARLAANGQISAGAAVLAWTLLSALGACAASVLLARRSSADAAAGLLGRVCGGGGRVDCDGVIASRWGRILGVDLSALGVGFFAASLVSLAVAAALPAEIAGALYRALGIAHLLALGPALFLVAVQVYPLARLCPLCLLVDAVILAGAILGLLVAPAGAVFSALPMAALFVSLLLLVVGLVMPLAHDRAENERMSARLARVAGGVWGALAELASQPPLEVALPDTPFILGDPDARFRLDLLVDPACAPCGPMLDELESLVNRHAQLIYVAVHVPARNPDDPADRATRVALAAAGTPAAYRKAKGMLDELEQLAAGHGANAVLAALGGPICADALALAEAAQDDADALLSAAGDVTPALLLGGRVWNAPVAELEVLLSAHPEVLASLVEDETAR